MSGVCLLLVGVDFAPCLHAQNVAPFEGMAALSPIVGVPIEIPVSNSARRAHA